MPVEDEARVVDAAGAFVVVAEEAVVDAEFVVVLVTALFVVETGAVVPLGTVDVTFVEATVVAAVVSL